MNKYRTDEELINICEDFIAASMEYDKIGRPNDPPWKDTIPIMCNILYEFGNRIRQNNQVSEYILNLYLNTGECLAYELIHLNDWSRVESIYHHMACMYKDYTSEIDEERLIYYQKQEREAQLNKHEQQSLGCFGCLGIIIIIGILYKILF